MEERRVQGKARTNQGETQPRPQRFGDATGHSISHRAPSKSSTWRTIQRRLHPPVKFIAGKYHTVAAALAGDADVGADAADAPLGGAARVRLAQADPLADDPGAG